MSDREILNELTADSHYLVDLYAQWEEAPESVDASFAEFFRSLGDAKGIAQADSAGPSWEQEKLRRQEERERRKRAVAPRSSQPSESDGRDILAVARLIHDFRTYGYLWTSFDPLGLAAPRSHFSLEDYGFSGGDEGRILYTGDLLKDLLGEATTHKLGDIVAALSKIYCCDVGYEFLYMKSPAQISWFLEAVEGSGREKIACTKEESLELLKEICHAEGFESFCHKRFVGAKRFGLEGGEVFIPAINAIIAQAVNDDIPAIVVGMAHRGRLNTLVNVLGKPYGDVFGEFSGDTDALFPYGAGDVKYHLGYETHKFVGEKQARLYLLPNPSHLEAVDPVVCGAVRALQDQDGRHDLGILVHGDAAFAGQGVVYETLEMSQLAGYKTGGTIHIVINNQLGFTTNPSDGNSGFCATDVAKSVEAPVIHVNGDKPEAVLQAAKLAFAYRRQFQADIVLDIVCFRRYGHNESDEPVFTQPKMYKAIKGHPGLFQVYSRALTERGLVTEAECSELWTGFESDLERAYDGAGGANVHQEKKHFKEGQSREVSATPTVSASKIQVVEQALVSIPDDFALHRKIKRQLKHKTDMFEGKAGFDWATAEALALGTLLLDNVDIRFSGEDSQRGTFSQRHLVWFDQNTQEAFVPLRHLSQEQGEFQIWNSLLSEYAVLGFEYGYSVFNPRALTIWEAQFGDFVNCAQVIIDQFISAARSKWNYESGLVLLLPHGYEGQGPEHSSARLERFLQLCAEDNLRVCNTTTPANYFHLLRRQALQTVKMPLVVMEPKSLLRLPQAVSSRSAFFDDKGFLTVIDDQDVEKSQVQQIIFCSGKVYYDLVSYRQEKAIKNTAIVRIEQLYPVPQQELLTILKSYPRSRIIWCQEEPKNSGPWRFMDRHLEALLREVGYEKAHVHYVGREESASPATGVPARHEAQRQLLVSQAFLNRSE